MSKSMNDLIREKAFGRLRKDDTTDGNDFNAVIRAFIRDTKKKQNIMLNKINNAL